MIKKIRRINKVKYNILITPQFKNDIKYYKKKKKYFKIVDDVDTVIKELENGNFLGNEIPNLHLEYNENMYKVRVMNSSINVGKSNGFRLIYYVIKNDCDIFLLTIYSKKDQENIRNSTIIELVNKYCQ